ncbi:hypothetical protein [Ectopseudomonas khazarica]|uniref:hypothetical protein n=1 Tax=Ectopseudomonas khazarica TaxID=2502979 RepID=UPI003B927AB4
MSDHVSIYKLGIYGRAYDVPGTRRAYTYQHQPDNQGAWRLGEAMSIASKAGGGDYIDTGLGLLKQLELKGYGVYELDQAKDQELHQVDPRQAAKDAFVEALLLLRDVVMHGEDAIDQRNGETVKAKCRRFLNKHGGAL